jgi:NAD(P)-dependent dehydrogenase (short-subunit alcohol dehydrogenase family)
MIRGLFDLTGRTAIVTGAGRGLGRAMSFALAEAGADVAISDINGKSAEKVAKEIEALGRRSLAIRADVSDPDQVDLIAERVVQAWGHIDILVNNAAINIRKPVLDLEEHEFETVYQVNLKGTFLCSRRMAKEMIPQKYGKIINIASMAGVMLIKGLDMTPYYVTKAAVIQFTKATAVEWAPHGVRVNAISPGWFITDLNRALWEDKVASKGWLEHCPMNRVGEPEELAGTVIYLASSASDYVTGHNLRVDGGYTVW